MGQGWSSGRWSHGRGWNWMIPKIPFNPNYSMNL